VSEPAEIGGARAPATETIADLRWVMALAVKHGGERGRHFATAMALVLAPGTTLSFEEALGLRGNWCTRVRCEAQADILRYIAGRHFPTLVGRPRAKAVDKAGRNYETTSWPRDHKAKRRPDGLRGDFYDVLSWGPLPGKSRLRQIFNDIAG
jgi:hypothetical protein